MKCCLFLEAAHSTVEMLWLQENFFLHWAEIYSSFLPPSYLQLFAIPVLSCGRISMWVVILPLSSPSLSCQLWWRHNPGIHHFMLYNWSKSSQKSKSDTIFQMSIVLFKYKGKNIFLDPDVIFPQLQNKSKLALLAPISSYQLILSFRVSFDIFLELHLSKFWKNL